MPSSLAMFRTLSKVALLFAALPEIHAISFTPVPSPNLDLSQLGRVALAGNFDSISLYDYLGQNDNSLSTNGSQSLLAQYPNGAFDALLSADASIQTMCPFLMANGTLIGVVVGGNFTSLGGQNAQAIALYNPSTGAVTPLPGLTGQVSTVFCDNTDQTVYVGGSFSGANSTNAIAWTTGWTNLPFEGFNGPVTSIAKLGNGNIVFGGSFTGIGNTTLSPTAMNSQVVNVGSATITSSTASLNSVYSNPRNIICQTNNGSTAGTNWLATNDLPGYWEAQFGFGFEPSKLRLYNTAVEGYGTKTWRFTALPLNGIMNFTYTDINGKLASCTSTCPLQPNTTYQDFYFVNRVGMNSFRIDISEWYGNGAGLGGIELFQDDIYSFAIQNFNEPVCDDVSNGSTSTTVGDWTINESTQSTSQYLTTSLAGGTTGNANVSVTFMPDIKEAGNYSIIVYTPGCKADGTCSTRGRVNITAQTGAATGSMSTSASTEIFQTNYYDKYDQVFLGYIEANNASFRPTVTLAPSSGQTGPLNVVAQRIRFQLVSSSQGLNGLFEFNPNQATINTDFSASAIDYAGISLNTGATVSALAVYNNVTYVAGSFTSANFSNIFAVQNGNATSLVSGGLNAPVQALYQNGSILYIGGNFTNTRANDISSLSNVASYSITNNTWQPLGAGVNGVVMDIVPISLNVTANVPQEVLAISGYFNEVLAYGNYSSFTVNNIAVWVPSAQNWLENLGGESIALSGRIITSTTIPNSTTLYAGAVDSQMLGANGLVGLTTSGGLNLQQYPIQIQAEPSTNQVTRKRATVEQQALGVVTGLFYDSNGLNLTVVGGQFSAKASNGSTIQNLALINGSNSNSVTGLTYNTGTDAAILALGTQGTTLFAGGSIPSALVSFNLVTGALSSTQPAALTGNSATVNAIAVQPSNTRVFVGGSFTSAGSFACPAFCIYDASTQQWSSPGTGLSQSSTVSAMTWASTTRLIIAGNLVINGNSTTLASYDSTSSAFTPFTNAGTSSALPGPITAFTAATSAYTTFFAAGVSTTNNTAFLSAYNGSVWTPLSAALSADALISGLQVLPLTHARTTSAPATSLLSDTQTLLVTGRLGLPGYGNASAALWNGTTFTPFIFTSLADGSEGTLRAAFVANPQNLLTTNSHHLALGFIVLIALAIALVLLFLLVVIGVFAERLRRRREGYVPAPTSMAPAPAGVASFSEKQKHAGYGTGSASSDVGGGGGGGLFLPGEVVGPGEPELFLRSQQQQQQPLVQGGVVLVRQQSEAPKLKFDFL